MKINREKFLAAALLLATNGGCKAVAEKAGLNFLVASQDPDTNDDGKAGSANNGSSAPNGGTGANGTPGAVAKNAPAGK